ncbi:arylsulfatase [Lacihabitans sp. LS3-19]|uniref:sulfatase family protein n=1 Tax=Lacihabitans sp. LS3-19 TaxID=2487335 RepID=UPI0020CC5BDE|nr:arylsulfatase [Lacihabitans sp. LS3-19]MCP9766405.1 arylsulfatase [Lacihabitans sp. LS3-19]
MKKLIFFGLFFLQTFVFTQKPNVLIIYADDLGYGDVSAYKQGTLKTPNIDNLAKSGRRFTNAYATSATCTPSRFALLTGTYPWRNERARVLPGDAPMLIAPNTFSIADLFKTQGYKTGIVGKWHLGLGNGSIDWNQEISETPNDLGFDYSYIMAATNDRVPTVYVKNRKVENLDPADPLWVSYKENFDGEPTALSHPELMYTQKWQHGHNMSVHNGVPRIGFMKGGKRALWKDETMYEVFLNQAQEFVKDHKTEPFFLYYALHEPHVPRVPNAKFVGKSGMGPRGDAILEADFCVGEIIKTLKETGQLKNTIVIFSSDNGPVLNDGYYDEAEEKLGNHTPAGTLRGGKYSLFEGGTKVPFIVSWPSKIKGNTVSDAEVCQMDLLASFANYFKIKNPEANDSKNFWDVLIGKSNNGRTELVLESSGKLAFRYQQYAYIPPHKGPAVIEHVKNETAFSDLEQLYDLEKDPGQKINIADKNAELLKTIKEQFIEITKM